MNKDYFPDNIDLIESTIERIRLFLASHPDIVELHEEEHISKLVTYNTLGGKYFRASIIINTAQYICEANEQKFDAEQAAILGVCTEMMHASFLIADDVIDRSPTRRGKPTWYKLPDIGLSGINDAFMLENTVYVVLRHFFKEHILLDRIISVFQNTIWRTTIGEYIDTKLCYHPNHPSITALPSEDNKREVQQIDLLTKCLTSENYRNTCSLKTGVYTFFHPFILGCIYGGINLSEEALKSVEDVCLHIGILFQAKDDYLDCYGDPAITGKIGTDIEDGKCTWFSSKILSISCSEEEKANILKTMITHYGRNEPDSVKVIKELYAKFK
eukprot:MONOS_13324.1-p1 / transcript=MONOS_13324.1 / gene=MONOS_13324 / organism=Monocercomonoides_exilis_PA203 / gene_product=Farnesyl pyrophosphate synthase 2 / transcript_product=Farnesyl pyrophosphate synthase 2 / location=Mono_scaffold00809:499-1759(-) / protein_length=328 / sequence_SO=supercontig / SO=protein_coding / is_pseudo=false